MTKQTKQKGDFVINRGFLLNDALDEKRSDKKTKQNNDGVHFPKKQRTERTQNIKDNYAKNNFYHISEIASL